VSKNREVKNALDSCIACFVPIFIRIVIGILSHTIRWHYDGDRYHPDSNQQHIFTFWHARLLMMGVGLKGCNGYTLVSSHRDGSFISDALQIQGFKTIRGSSTQGGGRALIQMIKKSKKEYCNFGITPDGPKGPREQAKLGIVLLAKKTGVKIYPVMWATCRQWRIRTSWDHFYIPKPFTRGIFVFGEPLTIEPNENNAAALARIQRAMDDTQKKADNYY